MIVFVYKWLKKARPVFSQAIHSLLQQEIGPKTSFCDAILHY